MHFHVASGMRSRATSVFACLHVSPYMTVHSHVSKRHVYCPMAMTGSFSADIQYGTFILPVFMDDVMFANNKPYGARVGVFSK